MMDRRNFLGFCCLPFFSVLRKNEPTPADPVPRGYEVLCRVQVNPKEEHVIFRNLKLGRYRVYINGKFNCEHPMDGSAKGLITLKK